MKPVRLVIIIMTIVVLCSGFIIGCESKKADETKKDVTAEDVKKEAREAAKTTMAYSREKKDEYQKQLEEKLHKYNKDIEELKSKSKDLKKKAKADFERAIQELKEKKDTAGKKLEELKAAGDKAWEDAKKDTDRAMDELSEAIDKAVSRFK